jgi:uncharacterized protein with HEPN domain
MSLRIGLYRRTSAIVFWPRPCPCEPRRRVPAPRPRGNHQDREIRLCWTGRFLLGSDAQDAVIRQLAVIGEAVKQISATARQRFPQIAWREVAGMRDVLIHQYFSVDLEQVWEVTQGDLKELRRVVEQLLGID